MVNVCIQSNMRSVIIGFNTRVNYLATTHACLSCSFYHAAPAQLVATIAQGMTTIPLSEEFVKDTKKCISKAVLDTLSVQACLTPPTLDMISQFS